MRDKYILTAESVIEGHPDKLCDAIADRVLDACLKHDPAARVACEVMATAGKIIVAGEITTRVLPDIAATVTCCISAIRFQRIAHSAPERLSRSSSIFKKAAGTVQINWRWPPLGWGPRSLTMPLFTI